MTTFNTDDEGRRLDKLGERVDEVRKDALPEEDDEPRFEETGTIGDEYVDDAIAPPG